jgi:translation initiation factor 2B subunit (eIF-2B alpha/beta/delta family)
LTAHAGSAAVAVLTASLLMVLAESIRTLFSSFYEEHAREQDELIQEARVLNS